MANVVAADAGNVAAFLAKAIGKGSSGISQHEIAESISEIEEETQTKGSSFIKIHFIDPEWELITSGLFDRNNEGLLPEITVEFPQHTRCFWVLVSCEPTNELSQPNFVATFEDQIVRKLKNKWGARRATPGHNTRAEFIKSLCIEAGVKYRIPSAEGAQERLNKQLSAVGEARRELEGIANAFKAEKAEEEENLTLTPETEAALKANALKEAGVSAGSGVKIKGAPASSAQLELINQVMGIANSLKAGQLPTEALIEACIVENDFTNNPGGGGGSTGLLQLIPSTAKALGVDPLNVGQTVTAFLTKTQGGATGGAIGYARAHPHATAFEVAQAVQASGAGAASNGAANYGKYATEAREIIAKYGGVKAAAGGGIPTTSTEGEVARGTTENPSENSWDCIQRLAGKVNFSAFTNGQTLFYLDGPEMVTQKPSLFIYPKPSENKIVKENGGHKVTETGVIQVPLSATFDNTSVEFFEDRKIKGKAQKRSRIGKPQSPSEIRMQLVCEAKAYAAGEVFEIVNAGPLNGRWIVVDATRNYFKDCFTQFLLEPPSAPTPESEEGEPEEHPEQISPVTGKPLSGKGGYSRLIGSGASYAGPDQGLDFTGKAAMFALADGVVTRIERSGSGWPGEGAILVYELLSGPHRGRFVYTAEDFRPTASFNKGTRFKEGDQIGIASGSGQAPGIETGFAQNAHGSAYGSTSDGKGGNPPSPEAIAFKKYVETGE